MQQYCMETVPNIGIDEKPMASTVPKMALEPNSMLHTIYVLAALSMAYGARDRGNGTVRATLTEVHHRYLDISVREHRDEVARLVRDKRDDHVSVTSSLQRMLSVAVFLNRGRGPYGALHE